MIKFIRDNVTYNIFMGVITLLSLIYLALGDGSLGKVLTMLCFCHWGAFFWLHLMEHNRMMSEESIRDRQERERLMREHMGRPLGERLLEISAESKVAIILGSKQSVYILASAMGIYMLSISYVLFGFAFEVMPMVILALIMSFLLPSLWYLIYYSRERWRFNKYMKGL